MRWLIFDDIIADHRFELDGHAHARSATVCTEWQLTFKEENFEVLLLDQDCLDALERYVSQIWQGRGCQENVSLLR
jgi:hypothetical protein